MIEEDPLSKIPDESFDRHLANYYRLLQVDNEAAQTEVQRAYREKIQQYHPDRSDHEHAEEIANALNQAKEVLLDQNERIRYNELGHDQYYTESLTATSHTFDEDQEIESDYETSIYDLIKLAKVNEYKSEPWWKTVIKSTGFKIFLFVSGFLFVSYIALVVL